MTPEKISDRIRAYLRKQEEVSVRPDATSSSLCSERMALSSNPSGELKGMSGILWRCGIKYAYAIKKIPVVKRLAEAYYWKLASRRTSLFSTRTPVSQEMTSDYNQFLKRLKKEGLKGRIKLLIFRFIGFFAWWQEQINYWLFQELRSVRVHSERTETGVNDLKGDVAVLTKSVEMLSRELKEGQLPVRPGQTLALDDVTYIAFEDRFRGSRELIKERQSQYLSFIHKAYNQTKGDYLLDIGCGRGEFLELLSDVVPSKGIDVNKESIRSCLEHGLNAELADALDFLRSVENNTLVGITAFQVIEHWRPRYLIELLRLSYRKIKTGGSIILETINPLSLYSLRDFFADFTHVKPVSPHTLSFLLEASGFIDITVRFSSPVSNEAKLSGDDENTRKLNEILFGFQDYAVIAWK